MSDNKKKGNQSGYPKAVRIMCIVLATLTVLGAAGVLVYMLF